MSGIPGMEEHSDPAWMRIAAQCAADAAVAGEVPVGAVIVRDNAVLAQAGNETIRRGDPTAHAEILVLREAARQLGSWRLTGCTLYVTLEPCAMCAGAIVLARVDRVAFGAWDEKAGMAGSVGDVLRHPALNHRPQVQGGILERECGQLLSDFFRGVRARGV